MSDAKIELRSVNSLLADASGKPSQYLIPAYQRGYRWTALQVCQLLDDIQGFIDTCEERPKQAFYCLQPLIIRRREHGDCEVVDGQQRLTTLYILMKFLDEQLRSIEETPFQIHYATRGEANQNFLDTMDPARANENVDFYHIFQAWEAIKAWFEGKKGLFKLKFIQHLLNDDSIGHNVKVIWFELSPEDNPVNAFTRLNIGKIPLSNDELIRALLLRCAADEDNTGRLSLQIANEWDHIEKVLQREEFWYFFSNEQAPQSNRIGLLFRIAVADTITDDEKQDMYGVFYAYDKLLKQSTDESRAGTEWDKVKRIFMALEEWYEDRELFHIIGFLLHQGESLVDLLQSSEATPKSRFRRSLREKAYKRIMQKDLERDVALVREDVSEKCNSLAYSQADRPKIRTILLLFNIATLLEDPRSNMRFQFDSFKKEEWDIEHVRSVKGDAPQRPEEQDKWLRSCVETLSDNARSGELKQRIHALLDAPHEKYQVDNFESLYEDILKHFRENDGRDDSQLHALSNLTLLDQSTNRSYKNAVFAVKRQQLLKLDRSGIFVPLCTRNLFLKCYSSQVDDVAFWSQYDAEQYIAAIIKVLVNFFSQD